MSEYSKKYPWLKIDSLYSSNDGSDYDAMDDIPEGWRIAFGDLLCEELDAAIKKAGVENDFEIYGVKVKCGCLKIYTSHNTSPEIRDILDKYAVLSSNICIHCGKPDVHRTRVGVLVKPLCEKCYCETPYSDEAKYEDLKYAGDGKIRNSCIIPYACRDNDTGIEEHKIYLKDTADKIRARWSEREIGRS